MNDTNETNWLTDLFAAGEAATESIMTYAAQPIAKSAATSCPRCSGTGNLPYYQHIKGGVCFKCSGTGN